MTESARRANFVVANRVYFVDALTMRTMGRIRKNLTNDGAASR